MKSTRLEVGWDQAEGAQIHKALSAAVNLIINGADDKTEQCLRTGSVILCLPFRNVFSALTGARGQGASHRLASRHPIPTPCQYGQDRC